MGEISYSELERFDGIPGPQDWIELSPEESRELNTEIVDTAMELGASQRAAAAQEEIEAEQRNWEAHLRRKMGG